MATPSRTALLAVVGAAMVACGIDAVGSLTSSTTDPTASPSPGNDGAPGPTPGPDPSEPIADAATLEGSVDPPIDPADAGDDDAGDAGDDAGDAATPVPPTLELTHAAAPANVDLTAEGVVDWAHWGINGQLTSIRKAGTPKISSLGIAYNKVGVNGGLGTTFSWTNAPNGAGSSTNSVYLYQASNSSFTVRVPATKYLQTFVVWVGGDRTRGKLTASLSDNSVAAKSDTSYSSNSGSYRAQYTIRYASAGAGELRVVWTIDQTLGGDTIRFGAAALR